MRGEAVHGRAASPSSGLLVPLVCLGEFLRDAVTVFIECAEVVHGHRVALSGSLLVPVSRLGVVLLHATAIFVKHAEIGHGARVVLSGRLLVPLTRLGVVLRHTKTMLVSPAKVARGTRIAVSRASRKQRKHLLPGFDLHPILFISNDGYRAIQYVVGLFFLLFGFLFLLLRKY